MAVKHGPCWLTLKERIQAFETKCKKKLLRISYLEHQTNGWVRSKINFFVGPLEPLPATVKKQKLAWFGHVTCHTTACPKPPFRAPWRVGEAVAGRENAGWTTSKNGHPCPCQNCSQGPPAGNTGRDFRLSRPSVPLMI